MLHAKKTILPALRLLRRRTIITSSVAPSPDVFIERPEVVVLAESALYGDNNSWEGYSRSFFPSSGLHFASIDVFRRSHAAGHRPLHDGDSLDALERTMAEDLSRLGGDVHDIGDASSSAHVVLIARGPVQCIVAQYFLESSPLAGLVLVDPLLLPEDGRPMGGKEGKTNSGGGASPRWTTSLMDLISMLEDAHAASENESAIGPPLLFRVHEDNATAALQSTEGEIALLRSLAAKEDLGASSEERHSRPLRLEPGSVPMLVMYSGGDHVHRDRYRICAERTAAFHTCGGKGDHYDQVPVLRIQKDRVVRGGGDDLRASMRLIYEWYDEVVA